MVNEWLHINFCPKFWNEDLSSFAYLRADCCLHPCCFITTFRSLCLRYSSGPCWSRWPKCCSEMKPLFNLECLGKSHLFFCFFHRHLMLRHIYTVSRIYQSSIEFIVTISSNTNKVRKIMSTLEYSDRKYALPTFGCALTPPWPTAYVLEILASVLYYLYSDLWQWIGEKLRQIRTEGQFSHSSHSRYQLARWITQHTGPHTRWRP